MRFRGKMLITVPEFEFMQQSYTPSLFFFSEDLHTYTPSHPHPIAGLMSNKNGFPHFFELKCCKGV